MEAPPYSVSSERESANSKNSWQCWLEKLWAASVPADDRAPDGSC